MINLAYCRGKTIAIFGLGKSGISTAQALRAADAHIILWDDQEESCQKARDLGFHVEDRKN